MNSEQSAYDLFVSYARADNRDGGIEALVRTIQEEYARFFDGKELRCFFDAQSIENGEDWRNRLYSALKQSRMMICMLSENYLASEWCRREWRAWCDIEMNRGWLSRMLCPIYYVEVPNASRRLEDFERQRKDFARQVQAYALGQAAVEQERLEENECFAELSSRQTVDLQSWRNAGQDALRQEEIRNRIASLARTIEANISMAVRAEQTEGDLVRANRRFRGRIQELKDIRQYFTEGEKGLVPVLHGLAGEGKSALALAYAHAFSYEYPGGRFSVSCEGRTDLKQCFARLGEDLGFAWNGTDVPARYEQVWNWLASRPQGRVLVILDGVNEPEMLSQASLVAAVKPTDMVHVLATTRCSGKVVGAAGRPVPLCGLSPQDGLHVLDAFRTVSEAERPHALEIVRCFGGHALSLELAGAFLKEHDESDYALFVEALREGGVLETLEQARENVTHQIGHEEARRSQVGLLVSSALASLTAEEELALVLACRLSPDLLPESWLWEALTRLCPEAMRKKGLLSPWRSLLRKLTGLCLWQEESQPGMYRMHRLVREVLVNRSGGGWKEKTARDLEDLLAGIALEAVRDYAGGTQSWPLHHMFAIPEALAVWLDRSEQPERFVELAVTLVKGPLKNSGRTEAMERLIVLAEQATTRLPAGAAREQLLADCALGRGLVMLDWGLPGEAASCFAAGLAKIEALGENTPERLLRRVQLIDFLGSACLAQGDAAKAVSLHRQSAALLQDFAEPLADGPEKAEAQRELCYSLSHLALALLPELEMENESIVLRHRILALRRELQAAAPGNIQLLRDLTLSLDTLGDSLLAGGLVDEAAALYEESLEKTRVLHKKDPVNSGFRRDLSVSCNKKGDSLLANQDFAKALDFFTEALTLRRNLNSEDPENLVFCYDLSFAHMKCAEALQGLERLEEARDHLLAALALRKKLVRREPANLRFRFGLAVTREQCALLAERLGDTQKALAHCEDAAALTRELHDVSPEQSSRRAALATELARFEQEAERLRGIVASAS